MAKRSDPSSEQGAAPAKKKRGALMVYERMRDEIMWMEIAPESALDEVALAAKYDVSRTPVREALLLLSNEGFVRFLPNRTTIVAPLTLHNIPALLDTLLLLSRGILRSVAMKGTASREALMELVEIYSSGLEVNDIKAAFQAQLSLYRQIAELSENRFLAKYFLEAQDATVRLKQLYFFPNLEAREWSKATNRLHAVIESVCQGDPDASDRAVVQSILFEAGVVQRSLGPRFGHLMEIDIENTTRGEKA